jgi:hypothetical protein
MKSYGFEIIVEQKIIVVVVKWCRKMKKGKVCTLSDTSSELWKTASEGGRGDVTLPEYY